MRSPRIHCALAAVLAAIAITGCGDQIKPLPLTVRAPDKTMVKVTAARASEGDDVPSSWCLALDDLGVNIIGDEHTDADELPEGVCGPDPAPPVSGSIVIACDQRYVVALGATRGTSTELSITAPGQAAARAHYAALPPKSGFQGRSYLVVAPLNNRGATLKSNHSSSPVFRIPPLSRACPEQIRGMNARPFASFPK